MMHFEAPIRLLSEPNQRQCWQAKAARVASQRGAVLLLCRTTFGPHPPSLPVVLTLTRIAPRELDDDNLRGALKGVRDGIADYLETNDRNPGITWEYEQTKPAKPRMYAVRVDLRNR
jgi:hypothetical protein